MADDAVWSHDDGVAGVAVADGVVLKARMGADEDALDVAPQHGAGPDAGAVLEHDVADDGRVRVDEHIGAELRLAVSVGTNRHGLEYNIGWDGESGVR